MTREQNARHKIEAANALTLEVAIEVGISQAKAKGLTKPADVALCVRMEIERVFVLHRRPKGYKQ